MPLANMNVNRSSYLYAMQEKVGVGRDGEDLFPMLCFNCETFSTFSATSTGEFEFYQTAPLDEDICIAAKARAIDAGHIHVISRIDATSAGRRALRRLELLNEHATKQQKTKKRSSSEKTNVNESGESWFFWGIFFLVCVGIIIFRVENAKTERTSDGPVGEIDRTKNAVYAKALVNFIDTDKGNIRVTNAGRLPLSEVKLCQSSLSCDEWDMSNCNWPKMSNLLEREAPFGALEPSRYRTMRFYGNKQAQCFLVKAKTVNGDEADVEYDW